MSLPRGLLLAGLLVACSAIAGSTRAAAEETDFDFFFFVRQWPGSFCSQHACPLLKDRSWRRFTIHGLWPNYNSGGWPEFCDKEAAFDEEKIDDLKEQLDEVWPSYMDDKDSLNFWAHEWNKHGTCALAELPSEHEFFKTVLKLHFKYDLMAALDSARIVPSDSIKYAKTAIQAAIRQLYGVDSLIHCSAQGQLTEIWMCVDKDLKAFDCKEADNNDARCREVLIPTLPGSSKHAGQAAVASVTEAEEEHEEERRDDHDHDHDHDHDRDEDEHDDDEEDASDKAAVNKVNHTDDEDDKDDEDHDHDHDHDHDRDDDDDDDDDNDDEDDEDDDEDEDEDEDEDDKHKAARATKNMGIQSAEPVVVQQTQAEDVQAVAPHNSRPSPQPGAARPILISAAGALLACVVALTLMASWARRCGAEESSVVVHQRRVHYLPVCRDQPQGQAAGFVDPEAGQALQQPLLQH